jgi:RimJ/RimL family protein N-acetyltransferase
MVCLRYIKSKDYDILKKWINDKDLVEYNSPYHKVSDEEHDSWFQSISSENKKCVFFMIETLKTNITIGSCQLKNIDKEKKSAELQIRIGEIGFHGKGYGTEAVKQLCLYGFHVLELDQIHLSVFETNIRAQKCYLKCGFSITGHLPNTVKINGNHTRLILMTKLNSGFNHIA